MRSTDPGSLHMLYVHSTALGYARMGVKIADALTRRGVAVDDTLDESADLRDASELKHLVCWMSTPTHARGWYDGQRKVILTMWESTFMPESFRQGMDSFDQIIVPSEQNLELFSRYHPNVVKVPLGVDTREWCYRKRVPPSREFKFLIGGSGHRKGQDLAYAAFRKVFKTWPKDMPRPVLQFKSPRPVDFLGERIEVIGGRITDEAERDLYGQAHCYLQPSRGEGFGLQPLQAIAQGLPTILTDAHGHAEFAYLGYGLSSKPTKAGYFLYGEAGEWWEPDLDELCQQMEYVYYNYDAACEYAEMASAAAHKHFSWEVCAERFVKAIGQHHFTQPYEGDGTWVKPTIRRYLVRVLKPWSCEIAGYHHQFTPGKDYWEVADVKRILMEGLGILDPSCVVISPDSGLPIEVETGLTEEQLSRFTAYSARREFCWTCHQRLGSGELWEPDDAAVPDETMVP